MDEEGALPRPAVETQTDALLRYPPEALPTSVSMPKNTTALTLRYRMPGYDTLPHVVKFSGGRSSAALAFELAEQGALDPKRGDVILFANTSAEHPGTYEFTAECKRRLEHDYGLPFLWFEFCTVERAVRGKYARGLSYRLVRPVPVEDDPDGYRSKGEVFEEMLSYQGMLPNPHSRSCTAKMKLYPSHLLLAEWLGTSEGPAHDGHYADKCYVTPDQALKLYKKNRGQASPASYLKRVQFMTDRPPSRSAQRWQDFTEARIPTRKWSEGRPAMLWGPRAAQFVTLLGLRADEERRVNRILSRSLFAEGAGGVKCSVRTQPPGEHPCFPLYDSGLFAEDVDEFWRQQDFDLAIPEHTGNCVFCFMKGATMLNALARQADEQRIADAPSDVGWWTSIERRYRREMPARHGSGVSRFGFLGVKGPTFAQIAAGNAPKKTRFSSATLACDCTD